MKKILRLFSLLLCLSMLCGTVVNFSTFADAESTDANGAELAISEINAAMDGTTSYQYIEIVNLSNTNVKLSDYVLFRYSFSNGGSYRWIGTRYLLGTFTGANLHRVTLPTAELGGGEVALLWLCNDNARNESNFRNYWSAKNAEISTNTQVVKIDVSDASYAASKVNSNAGAGFLPIQSMGCMLDLTRTDAAYTITQTGNALLSVTAATDPLTVYGNNNEERHNVADCSALFYTDPGDNAGSGTVSHTYYGYVDTQRYVADAKAIIAENPSTYTDLSMPVGAKVAEVLSLYDLPLQNMVSGKRTEDGSYTIGAGLAYYKDLDGSNVDKNHGVFLDDGTDENPTPGALSIGQYGYQTTAMFGSHSKMNDDGTYSVRFVASVDEAVEDYAEVGFDIIADYTDKDGKEGSKSFPVQCNYVYRSIKGKGTDGSETYTKDDLTNGHEYFFALTVKNISVENYETIRFRVTPYVVLGDETRISGETATAFYRDAEAITVTLDKTPLSDVRITYMNGSEIAACLLAYDLYERTDIWTDVRLYDANYNGAQIVLADADAASAYLTAKGIDLGEKQYCITGEGNTVYIIGDSPIGAEVAVQTVIDYIKTDWSGKIDILGVCSENIRSYTYKSNSFALSESSNYRVMTFNVLRAELNTDDRYAQTLDSILYYSPDVVGFQEYCIEYTENFTPMLENNGYTVVGADVVTTEDNLLTAYDESVNMTPIAFKKDRFELIDKGWVRMANTYDTNPLNGKCYPGHQITWVVLKDKTTQETFAVTSTHFFHLNDAETAAPVRKQNAEEMLTVVQSIVNEHGCAVIAVGDYNADVTEETFAVLANSALLEDARDVVAKQCSTAGTTHTYQETAQTVGSAYAIDHLFVSAEVLVDRYWIAINALTASASDHFPVFVDFSLSEN